MTKIHRFVLPLAMLAFFAEASAAGASDTTGQAAAVTIDVSSQARKAAVKRAPRARVVRLANSQAVRFPNCFFVFCRGQPLLVGVTY